MLDGHVVIYLFCIAEATDGIGCHPVVFPIQETMNGTAECGDS